MVSFPEMLKKKKKKAPDRERKFFLEDERRLSDL